MKRTAARQLAVQLIFAAFSGSDLPPEDFFDEEYYHSFPAEDGLFDELPDGKQLAYIRELVNGVVSRRDELDGMISRYAVGWNLSRISRTALSVLRCAVYEILYMPDIPVSASINEAVELSKRFDEPEVTGFINGILGAIVRDLEEDPSSSPQQGAGE